MKTAMQQLIEYCNKCEKASSNSMMKLAMTGIAKEASELLKKEKKQIIDAHYAGSFNSIGMGSEDYYTKVYETTEKQLQ